MQVARDNPGVCRLCCSRCGGPHTAGWQLAFVALRRGAVAGYLCGSLGPGAEETMSKKLPYVPPTVTELAADDPLVQRARAPKPRRQCAHCPWRKDVDPRTIPNGYCETLHAGLQGTIAKPGVLALGGRMRLMACHESPVGKEVVCVGYLHNQLGRGNNIPLRLAVINGELPGNYDLVGEQHERFEDTLPEDFEQEE